MVHQISEPIVQVNYHQSEIHDESQPFLQFILHPESTHQNTWRLPLNNGQTSAITLHETDESIVGHIVKLDVLSIIDQDDSSYVYSKISDMLPPLQIDPTVREKIIKEIIFEAADNIKNIEPEHVYSLSGVAIVKINIVTFNMLEEDDLDDERVVRWIGEYEESNTTCNGMVPASISSIEALNLEKVRVDGDLNERCSICLVELAVGLYVTRLHCAHVFHDKCIIEWLKRSHYCPLCRFEMPT